VDKEKIAGLFAQGRFEEAVGQLASYTIPLVTERETEFIVHDLAADGGQVLQGTFEPMGPRVMIDLEAAFSIVGTSRGALLFYLGQPDEPGTTLYDCGGKELPGTRLHSMGSICGDSPWAATTSRRMVFDVDPAKTVTWQILAGIIGPAAVTPVGAPSQIAITPNGSRAFITSPDNGTVTPIALGRPLYSYDRVQRPDDVGLTALSVAPGVTHVAADDLHAVVTSAGSEDVNVSVLDVETGGIAHQLPFPGALGVALTPDGGHAVVGTTSGDLGLLDLTDRTLRQVRLPTTGRIRGVAVTLDGTAAFAADADNGVVHRVALPSLEVEATIDVGEAPWVVRVAPDGQVWVLGRNEAENGRLRRIDPATNAVTADHELPKPRPNDVAIVPTAGQTDELVRTAWTVYDEGYSEVYIGGPFTGQAHTWHTGAFAEDSTGPTGIAVNDYGEIWVVRPSQDFVYKWPGGRFSIRPGIFFGEYCSVAVYGAAQ
jgi:DNA-binding beta-propeller fold protein YncE